MKPFKEVINGIRKAVMASEVREDIAQMGEYVEQFANTAGENIQKAIDPTLSLSGKAADAKATGNAIKTEKSRATNAETALDNKKADKTELDVERKRIDVLNDGGLNLKDEVIDTSIKTWLNDHPEATTTVQDGSITEEKFSNSTAKYIETCAYNSSNNTKSKNDDNCYLLGTIDLPENHTVQGTEYYNDYLYVAHHVNDGGEMTVSKYKFNTFEKIDSITLPTGIHGNSLCIAPNERLLLTDSATKKIYFIDLITFSYLGYTSYIGTSLSSLCFDKDFSQMVINSPGSCKLTYFQKNLLKNDGTYTQIGGMDAVPKGNGAVQDIAGSNTFVYILTTNTSGTQEYSANEIKIMGWNGIFFKDIVLPKYIVEPEGITRISDGFIIVSVCGKVYKYNTSDGIIDSAFFGKNISSFQIRLGILYNQIATKVFERGTMNSHNYTLDTKIPFVNSTIYYDEIGASYFLNRCLSLDFTFSCAGIISKSAGITDNGGLRIQGQIPEKGIWMYFSYSLHENGFFYMTGFDIWYLVDGEMKSKQKNGYTDSSSIINDFMNQVENVLTETGRTLRTYNFVFVRGIGYTAFPGIAYFNAYNPNTLIT